MDGKLTFLRSFFTKLFLIPVMETHVYFVPMILQEIPFLFESQIKLVFVSIHDGVCVGTSLIRFCLDTRKGDFHQACFRYAKEEAFNIDENEEFFVAVQVPPF